MGKRTQASINSKMLEWARTEAGLGIELAAHKMGLKAENLAAYESGDDYLTFAEFRNAARTYKRPPAVFYLRTVPPRLQTPVFRRVRESEGAPITPELRLEIRKIHEKREAAIELAEFGFDRGWDFIGSLGLHEDPEEVGMKLRSVLGVSEGLPDRKMDSYKTFNHWRSAVESTNTLVFQVTRVQIEEMRGLSIAKKPYPTIAVNRKDPPVARAFSLLHEFCHVMLGESSMCDVRYQVTNHEDEIFCNHVAGAALVPKGILLAMIQDRKHEPSEEWSEDEIHSISSRFGVSREVVLRRLLILGHTTPEFYGFKRQRWIRERQERKLSGYGETGHERVLRTDGLAFTKLVLNALNNKAISRGDVSRILGMKLRHLPALEQLVFEKGR